MQEFGVADRDFAVGVAVDDEEWRGVGADVGQRAGLCGGGLERRGGFERGVGVGVAVGAGLAGLPSRPEIALKCRSATRSVGEQNVAAAASGWSTAPSVSLSAGVSAARAPRVPPEDSPQTPTRVASRPQVAALDRRYLIAARTSCSWAGILRLAGQAVVDRRGGDAGGGQGVEHRVGGEVGRQVPAVAGPEGAAVHPDHEGDGGVRAGRGRQVEVEQERAEALDLGVCQACVTGVFMRSRPRRFRRARRGRRVGSYRLLAESAQDFSPAQAIGIARAPDRPRRLSDLMPSASVPRRPGDLAVRRASGPPAGSALPEPSRKRRNTPPSLGSAGCGGGGWARRVAMGWS